jgi:hypothetical protein
MRGVQSVRRAILVLALAAAPVAAHASDGGRFAVRGDIHAVGHSEDRRYALSAELRQTPSTTSADGRFVLKSVNVPAAGCDPSLELFADGFEGT